MLNPFALSSLLRRNPNDTNFPIDLSGSGIGMPDTSTDQLGQDSQPNIASLTDTATPSFGSVPNTQDPSQNFAQQYQDLVNKQSPNRLALTNMVNAGPPKVPISTGRHLAAILAAGLGGYNNPAMGAKLGDTIMNEPQRQSDEDYQKKLNNLSVLANMDSVDTAAKLKGIEFGAGQEDKTKDRAIRQQTADAETTNAASEAQSRKDEAAARNIHYYTNDTDGMIHKYDGNTGKDIVIGKGALSTSEEVDKAKKIAQNTEDIQLPGKKAVAQLQGEIRSNLQDQKDTAAMSREAAREKAKANLVKQTLEAKKATLSPKDQMLSRINDLEKAIGANPALADVVDFTGKYPIPTQESYWDNEDDKKNREIVKGILGGGSSTSIKVPNTSNLPAGWSIK